MAVYRVSQNRGKRGRPRKSEPRREWKVWIPDSVALPWESLLLDPQSGQSRYGARAFLLTELLRLTMLAWQEGKEEINISHIIQTLSKDLTEGGF